VAAQIQVEQAEEMVREATSLNKITTAARSQNIATDYHRMRLLADVPQTMEFAFVPDTPEELDAEITETESKVALLQATMTLGIARARLARGVGIRSLEEMRP